jgi:SpoIID/LytB domain protein
MRSTYHRLVLAPVLALALAVPAAPAATLIIRGAGYGHGVGMSQQGALGMAQHGYGYAAILAHYFTGTALGVLPPRSQVRVLLQGNVGQSSFTGADSVNGRRLRHGQTYTVTLAGGGRVVLRLSGGAALAAPVLRVTAHGPLRLQGAADNGLSGGLYRGALEFRPGVQGGLDVMDVVGVDDYARGVIAAEMAADWPAAALQAQAVASRSYAMSTHDGPAGADFEVYADTRSELYRGVAGETPSTDRAVASTTRQVVTYAGRPVVTYFFATSGGRTENIENVFAGARPEPWLRGVLDPYDAGPLHTWGPLRMSFAAAGTRLAGLVSGSFRGIEVIKRGFSPRVVSAYVLGSGGRTLVSGAELAARLGLYDTWDYFSVSDGSGERPEPDLSPPAPPGSAPATPAPAPGSAPATPAPAPGSAPASPAPPSAGSSGGTPAG